MFNHSLNGKKIDGGIECPACGATLIPDTMTTNLNPETYYILGTAHRCPGHASFDLSLRCLKCCARIDIKDSYATLECEEFTEPRNPDEWEYVTMSITSVKYGRVKNLGNYETERFEAEVVVEDQSAEGAVAECKAFVKKQLGLGPTPEELDEARALLREAGEL